MAVFLNPDPFQHWYRVENVAKVKVNRESCMAFLDNGTQINNIMPSYVKSHSLKMGLITNLIGGRVACIALGNADTQPLGYIIVKVQVDGVQGYNEDQIALGSPRFIEFYRKDSHYLGNSHHKLHHKCHEEREIDALVMPWVNARVAHLLSSQRAAATMVGDQTTEESGLDEYNEVVITKNTETVDTFSSHVIPMKVENTYTGECINIMTQAL